MFFPQQHRHFHIDSHVSTPTHPVWGMPIGKATLVLLHTGNLSRIGLQFAVH